MRIAASRRPARPPGPFARFFFGRLFPLLFCLSGLFSLVFGITDVIRGSQSTSWPQTPATIVASGIESHSGCKGGTTYEARITYAYDVNGTRYWGKRIAFGDYASNDRARAAAITGRYPENARASVAYDPEDPSRAVLETGIRRGAFLPAGIGALFLIVGIALAFVLPKAMRRQDDASPRHDTGNHAAPSGTVPQGRAPKETHPKVSREKTGGKLTLTTHGRNPIGWIMLAVALAQMGIVTPLFWSDDGLNPAAYFFLVADTGFILFSAFILTATYVVTVRGDTVLYRYGNRLIARRAELAMKHPMRVTLENRGTQSNGIPKPAIVVGNADGASFHFGDLLDDDRKRFVAGHLARALKAETRADNNPFES